MTIKLFDKDPYLKECTAKVVSLDGNKVILDQTCLFAFAGGQASDSGTINGISVQEVLIEGENIIYLLEQAPFFTDGETVTVAIDWIKRHKIMRNHSATHIVYEYIKDRLCLTDVIGSNVDETKGRIDYEFPEQVLKYLPEIEEQTNNFIKQEKQIRRETLPDGIMLWTCEHIKQKCCGTHVQNTSEIGTVRLKRKNIGKGKERVEIYTEP